MLKGIPGDKISFMAVDSDNFSAEFRESSENGIWQSYCNRILFKIFIKHYTHENI